MPTAGLRTQNDRSRVSLRRGEEFGEALRVGGGVVVEQPQPITGQILLRRRHTRLHGRTETGQVVGRSQNLDTV